MRIGIGVAVGRPLGAPFSPSRLFSEGEKGVWFDPSDFTTLFQDAAGTTPVTAVGQPVGLMLDKSGNGKHATQSTATSRPILGQVPRGGVRNLLKYSEQFNTAAWSATRSNATPNTIAAPGGSLTADTMGVPSDTALGAWRLQSFTLTQGATHTLSCYAKAGTESLFRLNLFDDLDRFATFNLETGVVAATGSGATATIVSVGNGWYRCSITVTLATASIQAQLRFANGTLTTTSTLYLWGAQLEVGSTATAYQRTTELYDVYEEGQAHLNLLAFDGIDDWLSTAAIDFTGTDKMTVVAGVRKLSDAAAGTVAELSASIASNNGAFLLSAPFSAAANYGISSKGTVRADNTLITYTAPVTSVLAASCDISGDSVSAKVNGGAAINVATDQGTGNYGNYPLYIGRRGGTTLPFNGRLYGLIVRGAASTDAQIAAAEAYTNSKTGAY